MTRDVTSVLLQGLVHNGELRKCREASVKKHRIVIVIMNYFGFLVTVSLGILHRKQ